LDFYGDDNLVQVVYYQSPIGLVEITGDAAGVHSLDFVEKPRHESLSNPNLEKAVKQLSGYFQGVRKKFDLPLVIQGTEFQQQVWRQLLKIPFGYFVTYQEVANAISRPRAVRAVGAANARNLISIFVPCHRVIGSDGSLTGYGGGLWRKEWLLRHEGALLS
jgi:methylated-DNA-[protein]-cysteine S-methyltransferase